MDFNSTMQKTPLPDLIYITRSALQVIQSEASRHSGHEQGENETGGILVGRRLDGVNRVEVLLVAATGPGAAAYHHEVEFNPDVDYVNQKLSEYHTVYPLMDYIGTWHKHPLSYPMFSEGDVRTAHKIFRDPSYKMDEIINPIVWVDNGSFTIRYYYMSRSMAARGERFAEIAQTKVKLIDDNHDLVTKEKGRTVADALLERIGEERRRLVEQGYQVELKQHEQEYFFTVRAVERPGLAIHLVAPAGYPQAPPSLFVEQNGQEIASNDGGVIERWGSDPGHSYLVDVVKGVLGNLVIPPSLPPASAPPTNGQGGRSTGGAPPARRTSGFGFVTMAGVGVLLLAAVIGVVVWQFAGASQTQPSATASAGTATAMTGQAQSTEPPDARQATAKAATAQAVAQSRTQMAATVTAIKQKATAAAAAQTTAIEAIATPTPVATQVTAAEPVAAAPGAAPQPTDTIQPGGIAPIAKTYRVDVKPVELADIKKISGCQNFDVPNNACVQVGTGILGELSMEIINVNDLIGRTEFKISDPQLTLITNQELKIKVLSDSSGRPVETIGNNIVTPKRNEYYKITINLEE
jgi:hypothetical protein